MRERELKEKKTKYHVGPALRENGRAVSAPWRRLRAPFSVSGGKRNAFPSKLLENGVGKHSRGPPAGTGRHLDEKVAHRPTGICRLPGFRHLPDPALSSSSPPPQKKNIPPHPPPPTHKQSAEEIEAQIERVKKRRRESAQRSRARKSLFVKSLEVENRELKRELFRLRAVVEAALAAGHTLHPSALVPPPSFAAAAGAAAAGAAAYFADEREDDDGDDREEEEEESCRGDMGERGASNAAFSSKSTGGISGRGSPISTDC